MSSRRSSNDWLRSRGMPSFKGHDGSSFRINLGNRVYGRTVRRRWVVGHKMDLFFPCIFSFSLGSEQTAEGCAFPRFGGSEHLFSRPRIDPDSHVVSSMQPICSMSTAAPTWHPTSSVSSLISTPMLERAQTCIGPNITRRPIRCWNSWMVWCRRH